MFGRAQPFERTVRSLEGRAVVLTADRSGVARWDSAGGGSGWELLLVPVIVLGNVVVHRLVFFGGWTVRVRVEDRVVAKVRCRGHRAALERLAGFAALVESRGLQAALAA